MLRQAITEKLSACIDEIFLDLQRELCITDGFVDPLQSITLDSEIDHVAVTIIDIINEQLRYSQTGRPETETSEPEDICDGADAVTFVTFGGAADEET